ncbi:MAG: Thiol-disulfide isomerase [Myxococcales bacterium]|nr:Thiol-disulfide isomerase [Myxococcales bacterium]
MRLLGLVAVAMTLPLTALPVAAAPPPAPAPVADPARDHYERGLAKYNLAEFDAAIAEFKQSYELSKAPRLLFNIAQAYRLKKDAESALYFYNTYLRAEPNPPNVRDVEERIEEMRRAVDDQRKHNETAAPVPAQPTAQVQSPPPSSDAPSRARRLKVAGVTVGVLGLAAAAVGAGMLGLASSDASTLRRVATSGGMWTAANDATYREGQSAQTAGIALVSIGGALVVAGGITLIVALRR